MHKLVINWQNFTQVGLQLKFAFRIPPLDLARSSFKPYDLWSTLKILNTWIDLR